MIKRYNARDVLALNEEQIWQVPEEDIDVVMDDGTVVETFTQCLVFSWYCWDTHRQFPDTPLMRRHFFTDKVLTKGSHNTLISAANRDCYETYKAKGIHVPMAVLARIAFRAMNNIYNAVFVRLESCLSSICAIDLVQIMTHPEIFRANEHIKSLPHVTKTHTDACNAVAERVLMECPTLKYNNIAKGCRSGIVRLNQVIQCVSSRGGIADIDGTIFPNPIRTGFAEGFTLLADAMQDSRSAARSYLMQKGAMRDAEYTNRQIQLTATAVKEVTHGDCGSKVYMSVTMISRRVLFDMEGIYYLDERTGQEKALTRGDTHLIHQTIKIRSVFGCQEQRADTICGTCFGELYYSIPIGANIGYLAAAMVQSPTGQLILSNKHFEGSAGVMDAVFSEDAQQYVFLGEESNEIFLTRALSGTNFTITIDRMEAKHLSDVLSAETVDVLSIHRITAMRCVQIDHDVRDGRRVSCVIGINHGTRLASLSKEMLAYVKQEGWSITDKGEYVINMANWDISQPFAKLPMKNFSTEEFAKAIETFYMGAPSVKNGAVKGIKSVMKYDNPADAVAAFHELVSQKLSVHHIYLQVLVLSTMATSRETCDYNLPVDRMKGKPGHYNNVIRYRSMGPVIAYERQAAAIYSPSSFLIRKRPSSPLDDLFVE